MRNVVASIAVLISLCTFAIGIRFNTTRDRPNWRESVIAYSAPTVPLEFDLEITYPLKRYPGETETDDGPTQYLLHHRLAWDECVYHFYRDWPWVDSPAWSADETTDKWGPWVIGAPDHINDARRDGWYAAANSIAKTASINNARKTQRGIASTSILGQYYNCDHRTCIHGRCISHRPKCKET